MEIMNCNHEYWYEFISILADLLNEKECSHDHFSSIIALEKISSKYGIEIDEEKTIYFFKENGGYCDCEVVYNVHKGD